MKYIHVEWMAAVPDNKYMGQNDMELLQSQAWTMVPNSTNGFHGLHEIVGRVYVTDDDDYPDEDVEDIVNPRAIDLLREITTRGMTESETRAWYRKVEVLLALDDLEDSDGENA